MATTHTIDRAEIKRRLNMFSNHHELQAVRNARIGVLSNDIVLSKKDTAGMTYEMKTFVDDYYRPFCISAHDHICAIGFVVYAIHEDKERNTSYPITIPPELYTMKVEANPKSGLVEYKLTSSEEFTDMYVYSETTPDLRREPQGILASVENELFKAERIKNDTITASRNASHPKIYTQRTQNKTKESSALFAEVGLFQTSGEQQYDRLNEQTELLARGLKVADGITKGQGLVLPEGHTLVQQTQPRTFVDYVELERHLSETICSSFGIPYPYIHTSAKYSANNLVSRVYDTTMRRVKNMAEKILSKIHFQIFKEEVSVKIAYMPAIELKDIFEMHDRGILGDEDQRLLSFAAVGLHDTFNTSASESKKREAEPTKKDERSSNRRRIRKNDEEQRVEGGNVS